MAAPDRNLPTITEELQCPTCGARQAWSDVCRRCRCDLSFVHALHRRLQTLRRQCLTLLCENRRDECVEVARECVRLSDAPEDFRRLAVCLLLNGEFASALATGRRLAP